MTDMTPIDDELISAYLDDEVTATERASIEADADSMARVAELRVGRDAVATPVTSLADADCDRLIAAALAASDTSPAVTSMAMARDSRNWSWRPLVAVAAAVAVIGLAVPVIRSIDLGGDAGDSAATVADEPADEPAADEAAAPTEFSASGADDASDTAVEETAADGEAVDDDADMAAESAEPTEEPADEPAADSIDTQAGTGGATDAFDPLLPELGDFESVEFVVDRVFADYAEWRDDPQLANMRSAGLAVVTDSTCVDDLDLAELFEEQMSDQAIASIADVDHVIWLLEDGTVYVAQFEDCSSIFQSNYFEG